MRLLPLALCLCCSLLWAISPKEVRIIAFDKLQGRTTTNEEGLGLQELQDYLSLDYHKPLVISLGDNYLGSFTSLTDKGKKIAKELKTLGVSSTLLNSQDLCYGIEQYRSNCFYSGITTLSTNLTSQKKKYLDKFPKIFYTVKNGYKIAFLGGYSQDFFVNRKIQTEPLAKSIEREIKKILQSSSEERPNAIILLLRLSGGFDSFSKKISSKELEDVCKIKGISAILISDENSSYQGRIKGTPIISSSLADNEITQLDLQFNPKFKFLTSIQAKIIPINTSLLGKYSSKPNTKKRTIAFSDEKLENKADKKDFRTPLGNFVCHTLFENISTDFVLLPKNIFAQPLPKGKITDADIFQVFQRDYRLFTAKISGKKLKEILSKIIFNSEDYQIFAPELKYDSNKIASLKCSSIFGLSPVKNEKFYTVLTTQEGLTDFLKEAEEKMVCNKSLVNSLINELDGKEISPSSAK